MTEWQPIETAPKDGTAILAFMPDAAEQFRIMPIEMLDFNDGDGPQWWQADVDDGYPLEVTPTHWMPLPQPPGARPMTEPTEAAKAKAVELANQSRKTLRQWTINDCEYTGPLDSFARYIQQVSDVVGLEKTRSDAVGAIIPSCAMMSFILPPDPDPLEESAYGIWAAMGGKMRGEAVQALKSELDRAGYEIRKKGQP